MDGCRPGIRSLSLLWLVVVVTSACGQGRASGRRLKLARASLEQVLADGAYQCAPRELALARAHLEFARVELAQGDPFRAEEHVQQAELNTGAAKRLSPAERCGGTGVASAPPIDAGGEDSDGDTVPDEADRCAGASEDLDGYLDTDGCPDPDNDSDGIPDGRDHCPDQAEDADGFADSDGCPDYDHDGDGVEDPIDRCPDKRGSLANHGCPRLKYQGAEITERAIRITDPVLFEDATASIRSVSTEILDTVAQALKEHPEITLEVQGHTDSRGDERENLKMSQQRAEAVVEYLLDKGIDASRLTARGYGEKRPIESNRTSQGRAINRRIEFVRTDRSSR